ncbi:MAG: phosphotransferase [Kofleriaceae bacterium]|nr:phosphotransferase [Kofleriaceae bacterium]
MTSAPLPPRHVLAAWGWEDADVTVLTGGLINATYAIGERRAVLQRLHPVFGPKVNLDLEAVTAHLAAHGMLTPRLIRTRDDRAWIEHDGRTWRALTWVDGEAVHRVPDASWAEAAGELVGRFHRAVVDLHHDYAFARAGVHDTAAHLARLAEHAHTHATDTEGIELAREILDAASRLAPLPELPRRHCHGDLKISNILFAREPVRAVCLVDLDTLGFSTIAFEMGDAMRSWCNPKGEDAGSVVFDREIFDAAIRGFRRVAGDVISDLEYDTITLGRQTVCIELAARFCVDVFRDEYFGWDATRFPSRRAHNLVRARGQLALGLLA